MVFMSVAARAQVSNSPVRVAGFRDGVLAWTNRTGIPVPVYQLMQSGSVTGPWQAALWLTNQSSAALTNPSGGAPGAAFYKVAWAFSNDVPMTFSYMFDEGYGFPAVLGTITLNSSAVFGGPAIGSWSFDEGLCIDCLHPLGNANFASGYIDWSGATHTVLLNLTAGSERVYLTGTMQTAIENGRPVYAGISGNVYLNGFSGPDLIGTFTAVRDP
jgi:hypothetical protein